MNILQINASMRSAEGHSTRVAQDIVARLQQQFPQARVHTRDLARQPAPVVDEAALAAFFAADAERSAEQAARVAESDALIAEVDAADILVLGVPMYNFGIPSQLKNWIDAILRAGVTFRYTEQGPEGLLKGKKAYVGFARGGHYRDTPADTQTAYLQTVLEFVGITEIGFVYAEGLNMGDEIAAQGFAQAHADLAALFA